METVVRRSVKRPSKAKCRNQDNTVRGEEVDERYKVTLGGAILLLTVRHKLVCFDVTSCLDIDCVLDHNCFRHSLCSFS